jgi:hypothetical protein
MCGVLNCYNVEKPTEFTWDSYASMRLPLQCFKKGFTTVTVWRVLRKLLHLKAYKLSIFQHLTDAGKVVRTEFHMQMFHWIQDDERFLNSVIFSDESKFHVSAGSKGSENSRVSLEHVCDSPKVNLFWTLSKAERRR